jgi:hypothetical protein
MTNLLKLKIGPIYVRFLIGNDLGNLKLRHIAMNHLQNVIQLRAFDGAKYGAI